MKKLSGMIFALMMCVASLGCVTVPQTAEGFYCETDFEYFETGGATTKEKEYIYYDSYTVNEMWLDLKCPTYSNPTQVNSCAPMAATIAIAYHDITKPNLIPDFEPGFYYNGKFRYYAQTSTVTHLKEHLYDLMGTNSIKPGTSESQFKTGMTNYVKGQGYSIDYITCGSTFNVNTAISYMKNQQLPIVMFLNSYKFYDVGGLSFKDKEASMICTTSPNGHVLVAFGYREYSFYKNGSLFRTDKYMIVSFGDGSTGLLLINGLGCIDSAYAVNIY